MSATFEKLMNGADGGLALLQVLAENSFDSVLITDASVISTESKLFSAKTWSRDNPPSAPFISLSNFADIMNSP